MLGVGPASARRVTMPRPAPAPAYRVQLIGSSGVQLQTYSRRGRTYVLGQAGQRYTIKVNNPTNRRVEAVVSVDGLDVIDGKSANFRTKRGYIVPPHGNLQIDGFRVSPTQVAAFRFSSVSNSYAGRKGKARNVGVIGVAIFQERAQPEIIVRRPYRVQRRRPRQPYWGRSGSAADGRKHASEAKPAPTSRSTRPGVTADASASGGATAGLPAPPPRLKLRPKARPARKRLGSRCHTCTARPTSRPGLGTKWGEYRHSNVSWTRFVRANQSRPTVIASVRYNNASGLQALGIRMRNIYISRDDLSTRETANPFPGTGYARPPR